jgi:hypothetical protein
VYGEDLLAWASYKAGRIADARRAAEAALAQGTEDARLFYHAGMIAAAAHDSVAARRLLGRALATNPRFSATQSGIARRTFDALRGTAPSPATTPAAARPATRTAPFTAVRRQLGGNAGV